MANEDKKIAWSFNYKIYIWVIVAIWTAVVAGSLSWNIVNQRKEMLTIARITGEITFDKDVLYRKWNSGHGGVYVPVTDKVLPNPFLSVPNRDLTTTSGLILTLINPAYMNRQVNEMAAKLQGVYGHITSLNPLRPENAPDPWEAQALKSFEKGTKQVNAVEKISGEDYMRIMRPFITEKSCLKCHASQGYKEGDIRGGISVSIPMNPLLEILRSSGIKITLAHSFLWLIGLSVIGFGSNRLGKQIHEREESQKALYESEERFRELFGHMSSGVAVYNAVNNGEDFIFKDFNMAGEKIDNISKESLIGKSILEVFPGVKDSGMYEVLQSVWKTGRPERFPTTFYRDERIHGWRDNYIYKLPSGELVAVYDDITEKKRLEDHLSAMSITDELTGLYNRRGFMTLSQQQLKVAERANTQMFLFFVDLDKMKQINDGLGHHEGDRALAETAAILKETFRESDIIGRMGGDEFAILAINTADETREVLINRLYNTLEAYNKLGNRKYQLSLSMGIAHYDPGTPCSLDELMAQADTLMYEEKKKKHC